MGAGATSPNTINSHQKPYFMMKTRRNGDAYGLLCGVEGCNAVYADVFPDRVLVYSSHYGRTHSTAIHADQFREISLLACQGTTARMECVCGQLDCATVGADQVILESQHRIETPAGKAREVHRNIWRLEEIEQIGVLLSLISGTMSNVEIDLIEVEKVS